MAEPRVVRIERPTINVVRVASPEIKAVRVAQAVVNVPVQGPAGQDGTNGVDGVGVPAGGTSGQILAKASNTDFDTAWVAAPSGTGGSTSWGSITGTLSNQTDLTAALESKLAKTGGAMSGALFLDNSNAIWLRDSTGTTQARVGQNTSALLLDSETIYFRSLDGVTRATLTADALAVTGAITQGGNQVWHAGNLTKSSLGLGNVDNTSDANKPVSAAQQAALDAKAPVADPSFTGNAVVAGRASAAAGAIFGGIIPARNISGVTLQYYSGVGYIIAMDTEANPKPLSLGGSQVGLHINGADRLTVDHGAATFTVGVTGTTAAFSGAITQGGNQVWHAGNLTPSDYVLDTDLTTALAGKANTSHSHVIADVTGLQTALDGKQASGSYAASSHTHTVANITDYVAPVTGVGFYCGGVTTANEQIGGGRMVRACTLSASNSNMSAGVAATASTVFVIKKNGTQIGTATFAASATTATFSYSVTSVAAGDRITIHAPATPDATLADIDGQVRD